MTVRVRFSTVVALSVVAVMALLIADAVMLGRDREPAGRVVVTVRLWDQQVAQAYRRSFDEFTRHQPDIEVRVNVVAYSSYFDALRTDVAGGSVDDIFWISNAYFAPYADSGRLIGVTPRPDWEPSVVEQFTRDGTLWGVPQLTDAGIALYYNADLLAAAGVDPAALNSLRWSPDDAQDTLRPLLARLTPGDGRRWAYNAGNDLQGIYLNYIGSAGGVFSAGDRFAFDNPQAAEAFGYLVRLINVDKVAPPASDTNDNGDFSRNMFLQGRMALFQSGTYNLAQIAANAPFRWGVAHAARRTGRQGQRHQRDCRRRQFGVEAPRRDACGARMDGQRRGQRLSRRQRRRSAGRARRAARLLRLLGGQGSGRRPLLRRAARPDGSPRPAGRGSPPDSTR